MKPMDRRGATACELVADFATRHPAAIAVETGGEAIPYGRLVARAASLSYVMASPAASTAIASGWYPATSAIKFPTRSQAVAPRVSIGFICTS